MRTSWYIRKRPLHDNDTEGRPIERNFATGVRKMLSAWVEDSFIPSANDGRAADALIHYAPTQQPGKTTRKGAGELRTNKGQ